MAKKEYIGVNGVARSVKKKYIGVNGIARKVKKGYVGVNGVARQFFSVQSPILFDESNGGDNTDTTGGWERVTYSERADASVTANEECLLFDLPYSAYAGAVSGSTVNAIDITGYTKFCVEGTYERSASLAIYTLGIKIGLKNSTSEENWQNMDDYAFSEFSEVSGSFTMKASLTLTGEQHPIIAVCENYGSVTTNVKITKAWFE